MNESAPLGCTITADGITIRVFCPRSPLVEVELFRRYGDAKGRRIPMIKYPDGIWEAHLETAFIGWHYGFRITPAADTVGFEASDFPVCDPYAHFVTVTNDAVQRPLGRLLPDEPFDWEGDAYVPVSDPRDLVIHETHLKDATAHPSAGVARPGTYSGFTDPDGVGGLNHLKRMGFNAIELMPLHLYAYKEPEKNEWNPLGRNHWGYMTTSYFAPEPRYMPGVDAETGELRSSDPATHRAVKEMVKRLHRNGMAVILDVVYNHVSNYDRNPLRYLDKSHYFRLTVDGFYQSESGCGNDLKTENPMARRLILDSLRYWAENFRIDGFRFDLGHLIDTETFRQARDLLKAINPNAVLIAEPWGGGYDTGKFSKLGIASWNDQIRNGVKGSDPIHQRGYLFGVWHPESTRHSLENYVRGTLIGQPNGRFHSSDHAVNYLESHDGLTLGDFIRISTDSLGGPEQTLSDRQADMLRLGHVFLLTSQGIPMLHAGQEWGRSKGFDHNSYEKDNEVNHLDYTVAQRNSEIVAYTAALIRLRRAMPCLRRSPAEAVRFHSYEDALHLTFTIDGQPSGDSYDVIVSMNANPDTPRMLHLPPGHWELMVSGAVASVQPIGRIAGVIEVPPVSGLVLRKSNGISYHGGSTATP